MKIFLNSKVEFCVLKNAESFKYPSPKFIFSTCPLLMSPKIWHCIDKEMRKLQ